MTAAEQPAAAPGTARRAEIAAALAAVRERITRAVAGSGRAPGDVTLVVVTKDVPAGDIAVVASLGELDVGESREQQLRAKHGELAGLGLRWHFIGRLQRNKATAVARHVTTVHSVDDERLLAPLARGALEVGRELGCLIQVNLDGAPGRGGVAAGEVAGLAAAVATTPGLALRGVMAVAPIGADPGTAFARLAELSRRLHGDHPGATWISAGMSGDLEAAVENGATHLRIGTAILGSRPPAR